MEGNYSYLSQQVEGGDSALLLQSGETYLKFYIPWHKKTPHGPIRVGPEGGHEGD